MAKSTKPAEKPATKQAKAKGTAKQPASKGTKQPATSKPATKGVSIQDIAKKVGKDPKSVRVKVRKLLGDGKAVVGRGGRYHWDSWNDRQVKQILASYEK